MKFLEQITDDLKVNVEFAKNQEEYQNLPAHKFDNGLVCCCLELDKDELEEIIKTGKVYISFLTFNQPLQPFFITGSQELFKENINFYK